MHLEPGHIIDVGNREGLVLVNKTIRGHECVIISFQEDKKNEHLCYEVFTRDNNITVKRITDPELESDLLLEVTKEII